MKRPQQPIAGLVLALGMVLGGQTASAEAPAVMGTGYEVRTSTVLQAEGKTYGPENMADLNPGTAWCEGDPGTGVGQWIALDLADGPEPVDLEHIILKIVPGYVKSDRLFRANGRPAQVSVQAVDRTTGAPLTAQESYRFSLLDEPLMQAFAIPVARKIDPSTIRLLVTVDAAFQGTRHNDMCVTELRAFLAERNRNVLDLSHEPEIAFLERELPRAERGDLAALQGLVRLVDGAYITSAEGGEWLNEIYFDLLVEHPTELFFVLTRQEKETRDSFVGQLLQPVNDKYTGGTLLAAVRLAQQNGIDAQFMPRLIDLYTQLQSHHWEWEQFRTAFNEEFEACEHWGGEEAQDEAREAEIMAGFEQDCPEAVDTAREALSLSPYDPVISAIVVDLIGYLGPVFEAEELWQQADRRTQLCTNAAFYYRAMTKYHPRPRGYFLDACPSQAANLPQN